MIAELSFIAPVLRGRLQLRIRFMHKCIIHKYIKSVGCGGGRGGSWVWGGVEEMRDISAQWPFSSSAPPTTVSHQNWHFMWSKLKRFLNKSHVLFVIDYVILSTQDKKLLLVSRQGSLFQALPPIHFLQHLHNVLPDLPHFSIFCIDIERYTISMSGRTRGAFHSLPTLPRSVSKKKKKKRISPAIDDIIVLLLFLLPLPLIISFGRPLTTCFPYWVSDCEFDSDLTETRVARNDDVNLTSINTFYAERYL